MSVYEAHAADLRPLVARFFRSPFEREEATQEIWLQVHRVADAYDPARGALLPWLRALASNRCLELLRARGRRPDASVALADDAVTAAADPEEDARNGRLREAVAAFAARLDPEEAAVFRLALIDELPHEEIAVRLGISVRRCKYLKLKLLTAAARAPGLRRALEEVRGR